MTGLMWKSLDRFASFHSFLWRNPVEWNPTTGKLIHNPVSASLWPWAGSVTLTACIAFLPTFVIVVLELFGVLNIPITDLMIDLNTMCLTGFCVLGEVVIALAADCIVPTFNYVKDYESQLRSSKRNYDIKILKESKYLIKLIHFLQNFPNRRKQ